jgi:hypothetical protein
MASEIVAQRVQGILTDANGKTHNVQLVLKVIEMHVNERTDPVQRALDRIEIASGAQGAPDGSCTLKFPFDGRQEEKKFRLQGGALLAG